MNGVPFWFLCWEYDLSFLSTSIVRFFLQNVYAPKVMHIFLQIAKGLQYVHACGLIHRDLKPANCFLMAEGTVKIGV